MYVRISPVAAFVATVRSRHPVVKIEPLMACRLRQAEK